MLHFILLCQQSSILYKLPNFIAIMKVYYTTIDM